ncbi:MAG: U32 family peptidase, partial [Lachnospiraceae bacterium]|nr:U32 family peptidase [Lachnospiraceae bacterium]
MKIPEVLAPAGSYEAMKAAFRGGADGVYMGGHKFGARAYADNPDDDMLKNAVSYANLRGKKLYLTINTLLKDREKDEFEAFLRPLYKEGLNGVIVQDTGILKLLKEEFPGLPVHTSTQMTVTTGLWADILKEY